MYLFIFEGGLVLQSPSFDPEDVQCVQEGTLQIINVSGDIPLEMEPDGSFLPVSSCCKGNLP